MHEFSIAVNIVDIIEENARKANAREVKKAEIVVGPFSGVVIDALEQALEQAKKNTISKEAIFKITETKGKLKCSQCSNEYEAPEMYTPCPKCNNIFSDIIMGNELQVKNIEVI